MEILLLTAPMILFSVVVFLGLLNTDNNDNNLIFFDDDDCYF